MCIIFCCEKRNEKNKGNSDFLNKYVSKKQLLINFYKGGGCEQFIFPAFF